MKQDDGEDFREWEIELLSKITYYIRVESGDTLEMIKDKIKNKTNVPASEQYLFIGKARIKDEYDLKHNKLEPGAKIQLVKEVELLWYFSKHSMWDDFNVLVEFSTKEELCKAAAVSYCDGTPSYFCCYQDAPVMLVTGLLNAFPEACLSKNHFGSTPLHWAAFNGASVDLLQTLTNANKCTVIMKDKKGDTPLLEALKCGNFLNEFAAIEILADNNSASVCDENGKLPSYWANERGFQKEIVGLLLSLERNRTIVGQRSILDLNEGCYPRDTYSFLSKYGPWENMECFAYGFIVFLFQVTFLVLIILNIVNPIYSSSNSGDGSHEFIPGDVETPVKIAQYLAVAAFVFFADLTINDIIVSIDMLPLLSKKTKEDKVVHLWVSSFLRFSQGLLAAVVSFLLIFTGPDVKEIVLNFTAINFISSLDDVAFELANKGHFGSKLKKAALDLQAEELPNCVKEKNFELFRKNIVLMLILCAMIGVGGYYTFNQTNGKYLTEQFRVQFNEGSGLESYSGCYNLSSHGSKRVNANRVLYKLYGKDDVSFGYCKKQYQWALFDGSKEIKDNACTAVVSNRTYLKSYSSKSMSFDIEETFGSTWFSEGGSPLDLTFYQKDEKWTEDECKASFGDGECFEEFNVMDYGFDGGDCCSSTCNGFNCGLEALEMAFGVALTAPGDGFPFCNSPDMVDITIRINSIVIGKETKLSYSYYETEIVNTTPPLMIVTCDGKNSLMVNLEKDMENKNETVRIRDGVHCKIVVRDDGLSQAAIFSDVEYEIFYLVGVKSILIVKGMNQQKPEENFQLVPQCYFRKLENHVDFDTFYRYQTTQVNATYWLMNDKTKNSDCEMSSFIERYALTVMYFQTISNNEKGWIEQSNHCTWEPVMCKGGFVDTLRFAGVQTTIATEIGLLQKLSAIYGSEYLNNYAFRTPYFAH